MIYDGSWHMDNPWFPGGHSPPPPPQHKHTLVCAPWRVTFTLEVGGLEVPDGHVLHLVRGVAARVARHDVLLLEPLRQPPQVTVTVERVGQQVSEWKERHSMGKSNIV